MKSFDLKGKQRKNDKYRSYKGEVGKIEDNLLKGNFYADKPFKKLTTDVTQFKVCNEKVYFLRLWIYTTERAFPIPFRCIQIYKRSEICLTDYLQNCLKPQHRFSFRLGLAVSAR